MCELHQVNPDARIQCNSCGEPATIGNAYERAVCDVLDAAERLGLQLVRPV
jgi:hypothetical protein